MKHLLHLPTLLTLAAAASLNGDEAAQLDEFERLRMSQTQVEMSGLESTPPGVEVVESINASNAFLKEREPEMTAEEYALYEKVVSMLESNSTFALKMLEAMMGEKKAPSPAFEFILGNTYFAAGNNEKAEKLYRSAVTRFPTFVRAWNNLGILYYTSNRYPEAIECFSRSVTLGDREPKTFGLLGYCLEKTNDIVSAEMAYMQALAGDPGDSAWKEGLLRIYITGRQFGRAEPLVRSLIRERPKDTRFWMAYANLLVTEQRKLKAMALLEILTQAGLAGSPELSLLGDLYAEQGMQAEAVAIYTRLRDADVALGEQRLLRLALALSATGQRDQARAALDALPATLSEPGRIQALQVRADLLIVAQNWPEAHTVLEELITAAPMSGRAWISMGEVRTALDQLDHARLAYEAALRDETTAYRARLHLANLEVKDRHFDRAVEHLLEALKLEDNTGVRDYLARIQDLTTERKGTQP